jgi:hypothetical protein
MMPRFFARARANSSFSGRAIEDVVDNLSGFEQRIAQRPQAPFRARDR